LDFPGGTPGNLVKAIEYASQKPLNVIIPDDVADTWIPALKMRAVTVSDLFDALTMASQKSVVYNKTASGYQIGTSVYGFRTEGAPHDDSIWYFYRQNPALPPVPSKPQEAICRFYQLAPYLDTYKIEDITTAIETGWKMLGEKSLPKISFHKDTKLLIAVGEPEKLMLIDAVLAQLNSQVANDKPAPRKVPAPAPSREPAQP
jgi:hypothetical protein